MRQAEQISNTFLGSQIKFSILFAAVAVSAVAAIATSLLVVLLRTLKCFRLI